MSYPPDIKRHNDAIMVLSTYYPDFGMDYCVQKSNIPKNYLRSKVGKLGLKLTDKGRSYVNRTKHKKVKTEKIIISTTGGIRYPDKLSDLEKVALFGG